MSVTQISEEDLAECLSLLEAMPTSSESTTKWAAQARVWTLVLQKMGGGTAKRAVEWSIFNCKWRPSFAELRQIAAKIESPLPDRDAAFAEVLYWIRKRGMNAKQDPQNPRIFYPGAPDFSHPLIAAAVKRCGGWEAICSGDAQMQEGGLSGHFKGNYDRAAVLWVEKVQESLESGKPRNSALFPAWTPFDAVSLEAEAKRAIAPKPAPAPLSGPLVLAPAHLRDTLRNIPNLPSAKQIDSVSASVNSLAEDSFGADHDRAKMREAEAELEGLQEKRRALEGQQFAVSNGKEVRR